MPGPVLTPTRAMRAAQQWAGASPSVLDAPGEAQARTLARMLGLDDPLSQVLALMTPTESTAEGAVGTLGSLLGKAKQKIRAFHGSPHDFDKFDIRRMGTGEGAQVYGPGLYFAEAEPVAKQYRDALSAHSLLYDGRPIKPGTPMSGGDPTERAKYALHVYGGDKALTKAKLLEQAAWHDGGPNQKYADWYRTAADAVDGLAPELIRPRTGRMYEVNIKASPDEVLDWDAPLSQQPPKVREALKGVGIEPAPAYTRPAPTPEEYAREAAEWGDFASSGPVDVPAYDPPGREVLSKARAAGVKVWRYKDAMSRDGSGGGTHNYVVADDSLIDIIRKYGIAVATAAGYTAEQIRQAQAAAGGQQ